MNLFALLCLAVTAAVKRPNIVVILADDMGYSDIGSFGGEIATPNLDRLAAGGVRFTQFYNGARCCPTRASLLTGRYAHQAGVGHMVDESTQMTALRAKLNSSGYTNAINDRSVTMAEALRTGGYRTMTVGKWHVGYNRPHWPIDRGFDRSFSLIGGAMNYFGEGAKIVEGETAVKLPDDFYSTEAFAKRASDYINEEARAPFFLYLAFNAPHWPLHARPDDIARYRGKYKDGWDVLRQRRHARQLDLGLLDKRWPMTPRDPASPAWDTLTDAEKDEWDLRMATYAAMVDSLDRGVGQVLAALRDTGTEENTLVIFLSDNGGCAEKIDRGKAGAAMGARDSYTSYRLPWANASNTPFRLYKHWVHEGGISTPFIASWPAGIKKKDVLVHEPSHLVDVMATALDLAGVRYPRRHAGHAVEPAEGRSLRPLLQGARKAPVRALYWEHEGNRAVREGKWKLVARHRGDWELYDLDADRTELTDLASKNPAQVKALTAKYDAWARRVGARPWPGE